MIWKNLLRRKFRTAMFIVGISVVLTGMLVLLGVTNGLDSQIETQFRREQIDLMAVEANAVMSFYSNIPERTVAEMADVQGVAKVMPFVLNLVQTAKFPMLVVYGLEPNRLQEKFNVLEGRLPRTEDEIAIGKTIKDGFAANLGETVELYKRHFTVVGFVESGIETEDGSVVMTLKGAQAMASKEGQVNALGIRLAPGTKPTEALERLHERFPVLTFTTAKEYVKTQQNIEFIKKIGQGIGLLSVVGGAMIVFIFSLIIVQERTREIGLLRAIGWGRLRIIRLLLGETLVLSVLGALLSLGLSYVILLGIRETPSLASMLPVQFTWESVLITFAVALVLGLVGGSISAFKASNLNPLEAFGRE